jgi:hypothetical protein
MTVTLAEPFPWHFGGYTPPDGLAEIEGTDLAWVESHCEDAQELLLAQFRDKPRLETLICALAGMWEDLDDAIWDVMISRGLDTAEGVQLDMLGTIVDLGRAGWVDETYRRLLRAQILVLRSDGTRPALCKILAAMGVTLSLTSISRAGMAAFRVVIGELLDDITGADLFGFLERARGGGIRLELEYPTTEIDEAFTWADGDVDQADSLRGWADDGLTLGGYWIGDAASSERA